MKRRFFTVLSVLSLLLFVAVVVLWVRSHVVGDRISDNSWVGSSLVRTEVQSGLGVLGVQVCVRSHFSEEARVVRERFRSRPLSLAVHHRKPWPRRPEFGLIEGGDYTSLGPFQVATFGHRTVFGSGVRVVLPYWAWACVATLPSFPWIWDRWRRRRRVRANACASCGYDLRATPGRCPECGTTPAKATA